MARRLDAALDRAGSPGRAAGAAQYLKSDLRHHGVPVPELRALVRGLRRSGPDLDRVGALELAELLWTEPRADPVFERRLLAALLLADRVQLLGIADLTGLEPLLRAARTWALVDVLAADVVGPVVEAGGAAATPVLDRWAGDPDFWLRRTALLAHLRPLRAGGGDWPRFARYADAMLDEQEFFVRKAIGWVLRDTGRRRPELVHGWLLPRAGRASGVTVREAVKPLAPERAAAVLAVHRAGR